jgi:hypothetical protein
MIIALATGAALGFLAWWPLVAVLPWGGGHWLAATLIGGGPWRAGAALMREADPVDWDRMVGLYARAGGNRHLRPIESAT